MCRRVCEPSLLSSGQNLENWTKESPENRVRWAPSLSSVLEGHPNLPSWVPRGTGALELNFSAPLLKM